MKTSNLNIEKIVNESPLKTAVVCPGCETKQTVISNCVFIGSRAVHLCENCAPQYANAMRIINKVEKLYGRYDFEEPSGLMNYFHEVDGDWFVQNPSRRYRYRPMTPEERRFFIGRYEIVLHLKDDGDIEWWVLEFDKPGVTSSDPEVEAQTYFIYAMYLNSIAVDPFEAMDYAIRDVERIHGKV